MQNTGYYLDQLALWVATHAREVAYGIVVLALLVAAYAVAHFVVGFIRALTDRKVPVYFSPEVAEAIQRGEVVLTTDGAAVA